MAIKNPRKWRFTWEAQSHSPTLKLFVFDSHTHTNTSNQCQNLEVNLNLPKHHVSITWVQQQDLQNQISLLVPIPKVLIDSESPVSYRALADHIEVKLVLLLPVDHPIVASSDSVLRLTQIADSHLSTPLLMDSDIKKLSLKKEGVHFYCRNCSTKLTKTPIRNFVEMPSVNWQEAADNWFGACCCSFGGISEKLVTRYANCYTCVTSMCLLNCTTVTLFKDDLVGCNFPERVGGGKCQAGLASTVEDVTCGSALDPGIIYRKTAGCDDQNELVHDFSGKLSFMGPKDENFIVTQQFDVNEKETSGDSLFCTLPVSGSSENVASAPGCCVHATQEIQDHVGEGCKPTLSESSSLYQKTERNTADQRSFRNGFLGNIFMARSYNLSKDIEWIEFLCPCCLTFLGAYPSSTSDAPIDGGVRLFKCYISTCLPISGSDDKFRKYTLERMFTNQLLESAKDELSFRTLVRDLKTKSPMLTLINSLLPKTDHDHREYWKLNPGKFGRFGGKFVPETLITCLSLLEAEFNFVLQDTKFQEELSTALRDYVGRETPLYFAERLTDHYRNEKGEGPEIYLKREDLNHVGAHKINNAIGQAMIAKRMGRKSIVAATGAGQHGVATAAACAKLALDCTVFMGTADMEKQSSKVLLMKLLGAQVKAVDGCFKEASSEAIRNWVGNLEKSYYLTGTVVGPHPCPIMVREFQSIIGKETRKQAMEKWGGKPDVLLACVGSGSNALGLFHEFINDEDVRLIGVEAAGFGLDSGKHAATLAKGEVGVYHGAMSYLLQDEEGQILGTHSVGVGLEYPGVGPEISFLRDTGRAEFYTATDQEAVQAYQRLCRLEGIFPALEASHALAFLEKLCPTLPNGAKVVVNCSGGGDKDVDTVVNYRYNQ